MFGTSTTGATPKPLSTITTLAGHKHGSVTSGEVFGFLFREFIANRQKESEGRLFSVEPLTAATDRLRKLLTDLSLKADGTLKWAIDCVIDRQVARTFTTQARYEAELRENETNYDEEGIDSLRSELLGWAQVEGDDVLLVFFGDLDDDAEVNAALASLRACPNPGFLWKVLGDSVWHWPGLCHLLNKQLGNLKTTFIWESIGALGRPLPVTEIAAIFQQNQDEYNDRTEDLLRTALTPVELAYAVSKGALVIESDPAQPTARPNSSPRKAALKVNPLFVGV